MQYTPMPQTDNQQGFKITPDWRSCLFALLMMPLLVSLGFWQLSRAEEKAELNALYQGRQLAGSMEYIELPADVDLSYQPVTLRGRYLNAKLVYLDNRINQGRFGYEIITPFQLQGSLQRVLVNRGWLAGDSGRRTLPFVAAVEGIVTLSGDVHVSLGKPLSLGEQPKTGWPRVVQHLDIEALNDEIEGDVFPHSVRLKEGSPGAYQANWVVVNVQPEKHQAYAFQWFAMAAAVCVIVLVLNTNIVSLLRRKG